MTKQKNYDEIKPWSAKQEKFGKSVTRMFCQWQVKIYELSKGRLWNKFLGVQCAILTTVGRKSGQERKTPLLYLEHNDTIIMVASFAGFSTEPLWYKNLKANPEVFVQVGAVRRAMVAEDAADSEKKELWPLLDDLYEGYKEYRARSRGVRDIPIVIFSAK